MSNRVAGCLGALWVGLATACAAGEADVEADGHAPAVIADEALLSPLGRTDGTPARTAPGRRPTAAAFYAVGQGPGRNPAEVAFYEVDGSGAKTLERVFAPYGYAFTGGVSVAVGDVDGDGVADIVTAPASAAAAHVKVFDGRTGGLMASFFAFDPAMKAGVRVAVGDVTGDGKADIVVGVGSGAAHVKVFDGQTRQLVRSFFAYPPTFAGGVRVAVGDVDGDGFADIVTGAGPGGGPHVKVFSGKTQAELASFFAYAPTVTTGIEVGVGDFDGDGSPDVVTIPRYEPGQAEVAAHVRAFSGRSWSPLASFFAAAPGSDPWSATVASVPDLDGDQRDEIVVITGSFRRVYPSTSPEQPRDLAIAFPNQKVGATAFFSAMRAP